MFFDIFTKHFALVIKFYYYTDYYYNFKSSILNILASLFEKSFLFTFKNKSISWNHD